LNFRAYAGTYEQLTPQQVMQEIKTGKPLILDVNLKEDYLKRHLPTAKLIQFGKMEEVMPKDKNQRIIFYCMSDLCSSSHEMARAALRSEYKNVAIMPSGLNGWLDADLPTEN
ncbi:MAG: rhodanese-like domain-containing protein, partial [Pseudobdellovibrio sp.]